MIVSAPTLTATGNDFTAINGNGSSKIAGTACTNTGSAIFACGINNSSSSIDEDSGYNPFQTTANAGSTSELYTTVTPATLCCHFSTLDVDIDFRVCSLPSANACRMMATIALDGSTIDIQIIAVSAAIIYVASTDAGPAFTARTLHGSVIDVDILAAAAFTTTDAGCVITSFCNNIASIDGDTLTGSVFPTANTSSILSTNSRNFTSMDFEISHLIFFRTDAGLGFSAVMAGKPAHFATIGLTVNMERCAFIDI